MRALLHDSSWGRSVPVAALGVAATVVGSLFPVIGLIWMLVIELVILALLAMFSRSQHLWDKAVAPSDDDVSARASILSGHIAKTLRMIAGKVHETKRDRELHLHNVAETICRDVNTGFISTEGVRCALYRLSADRTEMSCIGFFGREDEPRTFTEDDARGRQAIAWILGRDEGPKFVLDTQEEDPGEREGANRYYETYISIRVKTAHETYGMLTIDAPKSGDLDERDSSVLSIFAAMAALAIAESERGQRSNSNTSKK